MNCSLQISKGQYMGEWGVWGLVGYYLLFTDLDDSSFRSDTGFLENSCEKGENTRGVWGC